MLKYEPVTRRVRADLVREVPASWRASGPIMTVGTDVRPWAGASR